VHGAAEGRAKARPQSSENSSQAVIEQAGGKKGLYAVTWNSKTNRPTNGIVSDELVEHPMPVQFPRLVEHPKSSAGRCDDFPFLIDG